MNVPPWFKLKAGKKTLIVREEPEGCGIRYGFVCLHGNNTMCRLLWELATKSSIEEIEKEMVAEYSITSKQFDAALKEVDALLRELGFLSETIQDTTFALLKVKGGT